MRTEIDKVQEKEDTLTILNKAVTRADLYVRKGYLSALDQAEILPAGKKLVQVAPGNNMRLLKLESFVYEREQRVSEKLKTVYGALRGQGLAPSFFWTERPTELIFTWASVRISTTEFPPVIMRF